MMTWRLWWWWGWFSFEKKKTRVSRRLPQRRRCWWWPCTPNLELDIILFCKIKCMKISKLNEWSPKLELDTLIFSCPGSSIYLTLVRGWWLNATSTQRVTFETWEPSDISSEWCQKDKKTKRQKNKNTKRQRTTREFYIVASGQFRTLTMFLP